MITYIRPLNNIQFITFATTPFRPAESSLPEAEHFQRRVAGLSVSDARSQAAILRPGAQGPRRIGN